MTTVTTFASTTPFFHWWSEFFPDFLTPRLFLIGFGAALVSGLLTANVAARPAAVETGRVATSFTVANLLVLGTRFANLLYLPLLGSFVDIAVNNNSTEELYTQFQFIIGCCSVGTLCSLLLLPTLVAWFCTMIQTITEQGSMLKALIYRAQPWHWGDLIKDIKLPGHLGQSLTDWKDIPKGFIFMNLLATGIWTIGGLCALYVSAIVPSMKATATLLSGLVNGGAAIMFSLFVDPTVSRITDHVVEGKLKQSRIYLVTVLLAWSNFLGTLLAFALFPLGNKIIQGATFLIAHMNFSDSLSWVLLINTITAVLLATNHASRVAAVTTKRVATSIAVYNMFFLVSRLSGQILGPLVGGLIDFLTSEGNLTKILWTFRYILGASTVGMFLGLLLFPTFVNLYKTLIEYLDESDTMTLFFLRLLRPESWKELLSCMQLPSLLSSNWADFKALPKGFIVANVFVTAIQLSSVFAAVYASSTMAEELARTTILLSSVINGFATITNTILVDPSIAYLTDDAVSEKIPISRVTTAAVALLVTMILGSLLAQVIFVWEASWINWVVTHFIPH